jgi:hypothetical protein
MFCPCRADPHATLKIAGRPHLHDVSALPLRMLMHYYEYLFGGSDSAHYDGHSSGSRWGYTVAVAPLVPLINSQVRRFRRSCNQNSLHSGWTQGPCDAVASEVC